MKLNRSLFNSLAVGAVLLSASVASLSLVGCIAVGGTVNKGTEPTVGQQLIDLQKARQDGAVDAAEYERLRTRFLAADACVTGATEDKTESVSSTSSAPKN